jgi:hypothetical protein
MQKIDTPSSSVLDPAKTDWDFVEVWLDPWLSPPYLLLLMGEPSGSCRIHDPTDGYKVVFSNLNYDKAKTWLLEDEYEPIEERLAASE